MHDDVGWETKCTLRALVVACFIGIAWRHLCKIAFCFPYTRALVYIFIYTASVPSAEVVVNFAPTWNWMWCIAAKMVNVRGLSPKKYCAKSNATQDFPI